ncbi:MAG: alpha/beta hydrolase, partial [Cyanobacteriota bacterium]
MRQSPLLAIPLMVIAGGWLPTLAAPIPIRLVGDQTDRAVAGEILQRFVNTGAVQGRPFLQLLEESGWTAEDLRRALSKVYHVDHLALTRFLTSEPGERFLQRHLGLYGPRQAPQAALVGLRAAILAASIDGRLSAMDLLAQLPTDFDLHLADRRNATAMPVCGEGSRLSGERGRAWLSWL